MRFFHDLAPIAAKPHLLSLHQTIPVESYDDREEAELAALCNLPSFHVEGVHNARDRTQGRPYYEEDLDTERGLV